MVIVLEPTLRLIAPDAEPEVTEVPFTVMVAWLLLLVGVTVIEVIEFATDAVYEMVFALNVGDRVPCEMLRPDRSALAEFHLANKVRSASKLYVSPAL
jgi:hypothetical protein